MSNSLTNNIVLQFSNTRNTRRILVVRCSAKMSFLIGNRSPNAVLRICSGNFDINLKIQKNINIKYFKQLNAHQFDIKCLWVSPSLPDHQNVKDINLVLFDHEIQLGIQFNSDVVDTITDVQLVQVKDGVVQHVHNLHFNGRVLLMHM